MLYKIGRLICRAVFRAFFRYSVTGKENVPKSGGVMLVANHASYLDPPLLGSAVDRMVHFVAKAELFKIPVLGWALPRVGAFPVSRGAADRSAIRRAIELLEAGEVVAIFPEGTRTKTGELLPPQRGAAMIALRTGVPVVPVGLVGTFRGVRWKGWRPAFNRISVTIGEPLDLSGVDLDSKQATVKVSELMMAGIQRCLREAELKGGIPAASYE